MMFGYDLVVVKEPYYPPYYTHTISPDREYQPLQVEKPKKPKVVLSVPVFKFIKPSKTTIYFDFDSYKVKDTEKPKLKNVSGKIILKGYASPEGSEEYNIQLSQKRINSVKKLLNNVSILKEEALGESACKLDKTRWHLCRKVEIIKVRGNKNARQ